VATAFYGYAPFSKKAQSRIFSSGLKYYMLLWFHLQYTQI